MQIEIKTDASCSEPKVIIMTASVTEEVNGIVSRLTENRLKIISGSKDGKIEIIEPSDIIRIYSNRGKVLASTRNGEYFLKFRLYEIESLISDSAFVRISNSEIINLKNVRNFDLSFTGTILVKLCDGSVTSVSRRYLSKIKKILGL